MSAKPRSSPVGDAVGDAPGDERAASQDAEVLRLQVPAELVRRLMEEGRICAADLRCLDAESKEGLQRLCLENCARHLKEECPWREMGAILCPAPDPRGLTS